MLTIQQMRENLVSYELDFIRSESNTITEKDIISSMRYIDALYRSYTDEGIRKIYSIKVEELTQ